MTFPNYKFGKGQYAFYPVKLFRFAEKIEFVGSTEIHKGDPYDLGRRPLQPAKIDTSQTFFRGFGHPNFVNPFEYGKSFLDKLFTNSFGTITQTKA